MKRTILSVSLIILSLLVNSTAFGQVKTTRQLAKLSKSSVKNIGSVNFSGMKAVASEQGVSVQWQTASETNNIGFVVYRITSKGREVASQSLVPSESLKSGETNFTNGNYTFFDENGTESSQYVIESISSSGVPQTSASFSSEAASDIKSKNEVYLQASVKNSADASEVSDSFKPQAASAGDNGSNLTDIVTHRAVVATPGGVKIGVKSEGLYRVTSSQLAAAGFNTASSPSKWQLYLNGVQQQIIVGNAGAYIEFYGKGVDTIESDTQYYYLIAGSADGQRMNSTTFRRYSPAKTSSGFYQTFERKERIAYFNNIFNGEVSNYFGNIATRGAGNPDTFILPSVNFASTQPVVFDINMQGITYTDHILTLKLNGNNLPAITGKNLQLMNGHFEIPISYLKEGSNTLLLLSTSGYSLVESFRISFASKYNAYQNKVLFTSENLQTSSVGGFSSANIRLFDVTNPDKLTVVTNLNASSNGAGFSFTLPSGVSKTFLAVEDSGILAAASVTANNPSTLATTAHNANLVVITHKNFAQQANDWATYRRNQGTSVEVVDVDDVYDEYSFGVLSSDAIRNFLQYAYSSWQTPPRYVLLIGDATYDPRNYEGKGGNYIPTKLFDSTYEETASDEILVDFNDDGLSELAIGRIPARTAQEVTGALSKTQNFEATIGQALSRGALFASDEPDGYDFEGVSNRLSQQLPASVTPIVKINKLEANANNTLISEMNNGRYLVNYQGHGNAGVWSKSPALFNSAAVSQLNNYSSGKGLSVFTMFSCLNGYFIDPGTGSSTGDSLSEYLLKSTTGGAVAAWSSTTLTTPDIQEIMGTRFYSQVAVGNITRLGDLIVDAKTTIPAGRDVRLSWCLLGDPMLKMK